MGGQSPPTARLKVRTEGADGEGQQGVPTRKHRHRAQRHATDAGGTRVEESVREEIVREEIIREEIIREEIIREESVREESVRSLISILVREAGTMRRRGQAAPCRPNSPTSTLNTTQVDHRY